VKDSDNAARPMRVGFACVTENRSDWAQKTHNLALSVRTFGGPVADAPIMVNVVDGIGDRFHRLLDPLDVTLRQVERFDDRFPHANKLRMFEDIELFSDCDAIVALDCDIVVVDDPTPLLSPTHIRAKAEDSTILTEDHWMAVYDRFDIEPPPMDCVMTSTGQVTYPWWNSGVVNVPLPLVETLRDQWAENVLRIGKILEETPPVLPATWPTDEIAFVLALLEFDLPFEPLPIWGNFPTCFPVLPHLLDAEPQRPMFVHYHHHIARNGFLRHSGIAVTDERVDAMNRARATSLGLDYEGLAELERPPSTPARAWSNLQARLKHQRWYRSVPARRAKRAIVNLLPRKGA
jgi:hypothetical protein